MPFGNSLMILYASLALQLMLRVIWPRFWLRSGTYVASFGLLAALYFGLESLGSAADMNLGSSFSFSQQVNAVLAVILLLFIFVSHLNFLVLQKRRESDLLFLETLAAFFSVALLTSTGIFVIVVCLPLMVLLASAVPLVYNKLIGIRSMTKGLIYSMSLLLIWAGIAAHWMNLAGSEQFSELNDFFRGATASGQPALAFFGWLLGIVLIWTLMFLPPFNFFDRDYEATVSWPVLAVFRWQFALLAACLSLKWTYSLGAVRVGEDYEWSTHLGLAYNEIYFLLCGLLFIWSALAAAKSRKLHQLWSCILCGLLAVASLSFLNAEPSGTAWAILLFLVFILGASLVASMMPMAGLPLSTPVNEVWRKISWRLFPGGGVFFILIGLLVPAGNQIYFRLFKNLFYPWVYDKSHKWWFVLIAVGALWITATAANATHKMFRNLERDEISSEIFEGPKSAWVWHYILLIPFIILGIYPFPLYNYVKFALTSYF